MSWVRRKRTNNKILVKMKRIYREKEKNIKTKMEKLRKRITQIEIEVTKVDKGKENDETASPKPEEM